MARFTLAYGAFIARLEEVELLRGLAGKKEKANAVDNRDEVNALCRGAVVLMSSHVEAFIKELGENALESFVANSVSRDKFPHKMFYHISKDVIDEIVDTRDPEAIGEKVFSFIQADVEYWSKAGAFPRAVPVERFNKGFANPAFEKTKSYLGRFGYQNFRHDLNVLLKARALPVINMLDHLVDTRNNIAHGDPAATKTPGEIREMANYITEFCRATDIVFANWCKEQFCTIRRRSAA